jgi:hypothetical protein
LQSRRLCGYATLVLLAATAGALSCYAQYPEDFRQYTFDAGVGYTGVHGTDGQNFGSFLTYQTGGGFSLMGKPPVPPYDKGYAKAYNPKVFRHWNVFVTGDFLYGQSKFKGSLQEIVSSNPQMPSLLSANAGTGKFYNLTAGPRIQYSWRLFSVYGQGEGGWLRRSLDLTGLVTEGTALQPTNPSVFSQSGNSGALRLRGGVSVGAKGVRGFVELGFLQGFAINHGTLLAPMISGGVRW